MIDRRVVSDLFGPVAGAVFDGPYRYDLFRVWDRKLPMILFVMLNPSTADEYILDPTVTRCRNFAVKWGFGTLHVANLFALRATDPKELKESIDPIGPKNDYYIQKRAAQAAKVVAAWGAHPMARLRERTVMRLRMNAYCLGLTREGHPRHPLYVNADAKLLPFELE